MKYLDMHCDTLSLYAQAASEEELFQNQRQVDIVRLKDAQAVAQFFAIFLPHWEKAPMPDEEYILLLLGGLQKTLEQHKDRVRIAKNISDIRQNQEKGLLSAILTMEDGRAAEGKLNKLREFYQLGVRALALTWNYENCFGYPNSFDREKMELGLKPFGKEAVVYMQQELGMLVDVSHLSDGGFYDVAALCQKPFIASHSNARALSPHPRNLSDKMLGILGEKGGVAGLNFYGCFLNEDIRCDRSRAKRIAQHARYMADKGGVECVGLGSDFDGIDGDMELTGCEKMPLLWDALKEEGFHESEIEKIAHQNVLRVIGEEMK